MAKPLSTEVFIERARRAHGNRYDYSITRYEGANKNLEIICRSHGIFVQIAKHHWNGLNCPDCTGSKKLDTKTFIAHSARKHNNFYDYSITEYKSSGEKVEIICPIHGIIEQFAGHHLRGHGCRFCRDDTKRKSTTQFLKDARAVHGAKFDYSLVDYKKTSDKVKIICPLHGIFEQRPSGHLKGDGCLDCSGLKQKSTEEFVHLARARHGGKYDYSQSEYQNSYTKIVIICREHGPFEQTPNAHLVGLGYGCQKCYRVRAHEFHRKTTSWFVRRAKTIHGEKYDYSLVDYKNSKTQIRIVCPDHGQFLQLPEAHLYSSSGCSFCAGVIKNNEMFVEDAKHVHGGRYDYSLVEYRGSAINVKLVCMRHGLFEARPHNHLQGQLCPKCAADQRRITLRKFKTVEEFMEIANEIHGGKFDYSLTEYTDTRSIIKIVCPEHGVFEQLVSSHLQGHGCGACSGRWKKSTDEFIALAKKRHGDYYDYSLVEYGTAHKHVIIICPEHGVTEQRARDHLKRKPLCCTETGFDRDKPAILYYLKVSREGNDPLYKIGVTNNSLVRRYNIADLQMIELVDSVEFDRGEDAYTLEQMYLRDFKKYAYMGENILSSGNTELFIRDVLQLDSNAVPGQ